MSTKILIRNSRVVDPVTGTDGRYDILIDGEKIGAMAPSQTAEAEALLALCGDGRVVEAEGLVTAPGLCDTHVHFRDPGFPDKETIETGAAAARKGGFTDVICMANTKPAVDNEETLKRNLEIGRTTGIHVHQAVTVTKGMKGQELTDLEHLAECGAAGFTDDGVPILSAKLLKEALERAAALHMPVSLHEEDPEFIASPGVNMGPVADAIGVGGASALAEEVLVARDCLLALETGADLVIQHISSGRSVDLIRHAKQMGAHVHAEATPHHFTLTEEAVLKYGTYARMNPPLRTEKDRQEIIEGLIDGTIDLIATDHAPHTAAEKAKAFAQAPSGITGLETSLALGVTELVKTGKLTVMQLMEKMSTNPARLYHLDPQGVRTGAPADLVVFAPDEQFVVGDYASKAINSPFTGWTLYAPVHLTICGGAVVYEREAKDE